jgi:hypothetical protein
MILGESEMTIHDELVLKLVEPDKWGKATGYIVTIVGSGNIQYMLEDLFYWRGHYEAVMNTYVKMTPDVVVTNSSSGKITAIELESDINWDFAHSLRQIKKYKRNSKNFQDVVVIIPKKYERFAILYASQGFRVYLWKAIRIWECRCGKSVESERTTKPKCSCNSTELEFEGVRDVEFTQFEYAIDKMVG